MNKRSTVVLVSHSAALDHHGIMEGLGAALSLMDGTLTKKKMKLLSSFSSMNPKITQQLLRGLYVCLHMYSDLGQVNY